jgi:6-phosphogluconolactonase
MMITERQFANRHDLARVFAADIAALLSGILARQGRACLAVSGGTTPALLFGELSRQDLDWANVTITLVDERQVPISNARSNARLVHENLLKHRAAAARFVPLFSNVAAASHLQLDLVLLGMGTDGHTASFFPDADFLAAAIDPDGKPTVLELNAPSAGEPRLTFSLAALVKAQFIGLHIEGDEKLGVLRRAQAGGPTPEMPIRAVLRSAAPVTLYWCP